jgi:hypothetical protein
MSSRKDQNAPLGVNFFPQLTQPVEIKAPPVAPNPFQYNSPFRPAQFREGSLSKEDSERLEAAFVFLERASRPIGESVQNLRMLMGTREQWQDIREDVGRILRNEPILVRGDSGAITREKVESSTRVSIQTGKEFEQIARAFHKDAPGEYFKRVDIISKQDPDLGDALRRIGKGQPLTLKNYATLGGLVVGEILSDKLQDAVPDAIVDSVNRRFKTPGLDAGGVQPDAQQRRSRSANNDGDDSPATTGGNRQRRVAQSGGNEPAPDTLNSVPATQRVQAPRQQQIGA